MTSEKYTINPDYGNDKTDTNFFPVLLGMLIVGGLFFLMKNRFIQTHSLRNSEEDDVELRQYYRAQ